MPRLDNGDFLSQPVSPLYLADATTQIKYEHGQSFHDVIDGRAMFGSGIRHDSASSLARHAVQPLAVERGQAHCSKRPHTHSTDPVIIATHLCQSNIRLRHSSLPSWQTPAPIFVFLRDSSARNFIFRCCKQHAATVPRTTRFQSLFGPTLLPSWRRYWEWLMLVKLDSLHYQHRPCRSRPTVKAIYIARPGLVFVNHPSLKLTNHARRPHMCTTSSRRPNDMGGSHC